MNIKITLIWDMKPYSLVDRYCTTKLYCVTSKKIVILILDLLFVSYSQLQEMFQMRKCVDPNEISILCHMPILFVH